MRTQRLANSNDQAFYLSLIGESSFSPISKFLTGIYNFVKVLLVVNCLMLSKLRSCKQIQKGTYIYLKHFPRNNNTDESSNKAWKFCKIYVIK